ncbi:zinc-dependent peptidase [Undibacterium sp. Ren11W]|uniref:M90 family metallopeptidase n=1 Tax=Undibacterium sp. Ren11W TaxID=3413045 RepID=UPI003BF2DE2C
MEQIMALLSLLSLGIGISVFLPAYRLRRAIGRAFPSDFVKILRRNLPAYSRMPVDLQLQLKRLIKQFLHQKKFVGCGGQIIDDEIRVTIAAKACMLLLNRTTAVYPDLKLVLVYPSAFVVPRLETSLGGIVTHANQTLSGESWSDGRVILAWDHIQKNSETSAKLPAGHDVVLHEFAHQLDSETGATNGAPRLLNRESYRRWSQILSGEFEALKTAAEAGQFNVLDHYGANSPAEFFAVATEAFFEKSADLANFHPELFEQLRAYYQVDPRHWN